MGCLSYYSQILRLHIFVKYQKHLLIKVIDDLAIVLEQKKKDGKINIENVDQLMMDVTLDVLGIVAFGKQFGSIAGVKDKKTQIS